jgi:cysteinyl-tRNA synthetase
MRRYFAYIGMKTRFVQNITDIDDKIIKRAHERKMMPLELSEKYSKKSSKEFEALGIIKPDFEPKVSEFIPQIISLISRIEKNGFAYKTSSGVYFDVVKFKKYGALSHQTKDELRAGARIEVDEEKKSPQDFALWKFGDEPGVTFDSPWGAGRPGWHIECSAMSTHLLGDTIDMHGGARDLIFPHHENEIAQSEAATGKKFARFFVHTGFLTVNGEKMAKSLGNFITIEDALAKFPPKHLRMLFALAHYSSPIDYTEEAVKAAGSSLATLHSAILAAQSYSSDSKGGKLAKETEEAKGKFRSAMDDDFDTPTALSALFSFAKRINGACSEGSASEKEAKDAASALAGMLAVLGIAPDEKQGKDVDSAVAHICKKHGIPSHGLEAMLTALIALRTQARKAKDFKKSDEIRKELAEAGILLEDRKDGSVGWRLA